MVAKQCQADTDDDEYVGLAGKYFNLTLIFISIFEIIINSLFSIGYFRKIYSIKNKNNSGISAVEKILCMVAFVETIISICWLLNNLFIQNKENLEKHCSMCKGIAHIEIFFYLFDWMILSTSLYQIKIILLNPQKILESGKRVIKYIIGCLIISLLSLIFSISAKIGGVSPMLTCFINIQVLEDTYQKIFFWVFFCWPLFCFSFGGYQVYLIMKSIQYKNDKNNREFFIEYSYFVITYIIFSIMLIISYVINYIKEKITGGAGYNAFVSIVTFLSCSNPLIVGIIRGYRTDFLKRLFKRNKNTLKDEEKNLIEENLREEEEGGRMFKLEKKILEKLIIKYFTAVSYALGKSKYTNTESEEDKETIEKKGENIFVQDEHDDYIITKAEILKDLDLAINEDIKILQESNIDIEITEYNSSIFKKLRKLEGLNEDTIISMFQPKKGTNQLIKRINETIYINSTNKLLMLKQLKKENLLFYQRNILPDLYNYLVNHPNSLICRVFGLYKIKIDHQEDTYMALMYNINESLDIINNLSSIKSKKEVRQMKISEAELKRHIIIDSKKNNYDIRNMTIDIPKNRFDGNINVGGSSSDSSNKIFKINLTDYENEKLLNIINQDTKFLRGKNNFGFSFLVFERAIETKDRNSLFKDDEEKSENKSQINSSFSSKVSSHIKKYIFNSNLPNIIYSICILDYFRNKH